ncbi:hypothetical protein M011DRAFT_490353 [Sporormia fimetaria CBS 119925]|uniref:Uncharacterized protein n=1 Tax=Sporormia fimetaria CBS 119925 TaxID=1340428 RepID=A0A6A6UZ61_9PLEO|nr:hypothetical protein M011DRAFT_490353 [Sporormia fimetaria CBS 119925]
MTFHSNLPRHFHVPSPSRAFTLSPPIYIPSNPAHTFHFLPARLRSTDTQSTTAMRLPIVLTIAFAALAFSAHIPRNVKHGRQEAAASLNDQLPDLTFHELNDPDPSIFSNTNTTLLPPPLGHARGHANANNPATGNTNLAAAAVSDEPMNRIKIYGYMGSQKINIGPAAKIYEGLVTMLEKLCPPGRGVCFSRDEKTMEIPIRYEGLNEKVLLYTVGISKYDRPGSKAIREERRKLLTESVARVYSEQVLGTQGKNIWKGKDGGEYFNVGNMVRVEFSDDENGISEFLEVYMDASPKNPTGGRFDCVGSLTPTHRILEKEKERYVKAYHGAWWDGVHTQCLD